jgi:O-antigen ligase
MKIYLESLNYISRLDKVLVLLIFSVPFLLSISIFLSDLFVSLGGILFLFLLWEKENIQLIKKLRKEIIIFLIFFFIILISLALSDYKKISFLPSFFYFRYFLLSMILFYILTKYKVTLKIFYFFILLGFSLVIFDSFFQNVFDINLIGYSKIGSSSPDTSLEYLTSFFGSEKKLGSYLVRFLPLIISLIYIRGCTNNRANYLMHFIVFVITGFLIFHTSERTALFLYGVLTLLIILNSEKRLLLFLLATLSFIMLISSDAKLRMKYIEVTLHQTKISNIIQKNDLMINLLEKIDIKLNTDSEHQDIVRYYSKEHEDLTFTAFEIFKNNVFFGSGIKTFFHECNYLKLNKKLIENRRNNKLVCSTHPHNTYIQILSQIGIFGFLIVVFVLGYVLKNIFILTKKRKKNNLEICFFYINIGLFLNIFPLIPSGSFFNNWISLIFFFNLGFLFYVKNKLKFSNNL